MRKVHNIHQMPESFVDDPLLKSGMSTLLLGAAAGSERLYVNIDTVLPGCKSAKYHAHARSEEFFLILSGNGVLRMDGEEQQVGPGDFVAKPAGKGIAHQFLNTGDQPLEILDCGTREADDLITYPDEDVVLLKKEGLAFRRGDAVTGWSSDPNQ